MRRIAVAVAGLAAIALLGLVVSRVTGGSGREPAAEAAGSPTPAHSAASGGAIDVEGARAAAVAAVASTGDVVRAGMFSRLDMIERIATPSYAPVLASATTTQVNEFVVALGASGVDSTDLQVIEAPITATATAVSDRQVAVEVWSVLVVSMPDTSVARQAWRTVSLDMVEVDGRWLIDGWTSSAGPAPALPPEGQVASRDEVDSRLTWLPVTEGGGR